MAKAKEVYADVNTTEEKPGLYKEDFYYVRLPKTKDKQDDVTVSINGYVTKIQRGVEVKVSAAVKEVLDNSEKMDLLAIERSAALQNNAVK